MIMGRGSSRGITASLWQISVALYLIANGVLGLQRWPEGVFRTILHRMGFRGDTLSLLLIVLSVIALVAGIAVLLDFFSVELPFLNLVVFIVAIVWIVYVVITIISWATDGFNNFFRELTALAVNIMVLGALLSASKRFG